MIAPAVLLPQAIADAVASCGAPWGALDLKQDPSENLLIVDGWHERDKYGGKATSDHYSRAWSAVQGSALWYEVDQKLHELASYRIARNAPLAKEELRSGIRSGWRILVRPTYILTFARSAAGAHPNWRAWLLSGDVAAPISVDLFDAQADLLAPLELDWPRDRLRHAHVTVVGVGSIGSVACEALASYGIRRFALIDPDRLWAHNFARHRVLRRQHGRLKVKAVAGLLEERDSEVEVESHPLDVARNADQVRPLIRDTDLVMGCPDGTLPRRMTSHLAFWARKPLVLSCVLENGAFGEVLRLIPGRTGCLLCNRARLHEAFDPEPGLDPGYDAGDPQLPMTAVTGDLALVGQLAAKAAIATLMERKGMASQRLAGDHGLVSLQPVPDMPKPFNFSRTGELKWLATAPPRAVCPSCGGGPWA